MYEKRKRELVDAFVAATRPVVSGRRGGSRAQFVAIRGNHNQVRVVLPGAPAGGAADDGALRRTLIAQVLAHARRVDGMELLRAWMLRTYGCSLLAQLTTVELRQAHREILTWRSAAG
jgi:hypothetical protein